MAAIWITMTPSAFGRLALGAFPLAVMRVDDRLLERWQAAPDPLQPDDSSILSDG